MNPKTHAEQTSNHGCRVFNFAPGPYPSYPSMQRQSFVTFALCTQRVTHVLWKSVDERCVFYGRQIIFRAMDMSKLGTNTFGDPFTAEWGYWSCRWRFLWYYCIIIYNVYIYIYIDILTYVLFISYSLTPFAFKLQFIGDFMAQAAQGRCCQGGDISTRDCSWPRSLLLRAIILFQKLPIFLLGSPCWIFFKGWWGILTPKNGGPFRKTKEFVWGQL